MISCIKIRLMYHELREYLKSIPPEEKESVDEQMIPFKGRLIFKQYLRDKPHSWDVKVFTKAGVSGIVYDIDILKVHFKMDICRFLIVSRLSPRAD